MLTALRKQSLLSLLPLFFVVFATGFLNAQIAPPPPAPSTIVKDDTVQIRGVPELLEHRNNNGAALYSRNRKNFIHEGRFRKISRIEIRDRNADTVLFAVLDFAGRVGVLNRSGKMIIAPEYRSIEYAPGPELLVSFLDNDLYFFELTGNPIELCAAAGRYEPIAKNVVLIRLGGENRYIRGIYDLKACAWIVGLELPHNLPVSPDKTFYAFRRETQNGTEESIVVNLQTGGRWKSDSLSFGRFLTDSLWVVADQNKAFGIIDPDGNVLLSPAYHLITQAPSCRQSKDLYVHTSEGYLGLFSLLQNKLILPAEYAKIRWANIFNCDYAVKDTLARYGVISKKGLIRIPFHYSGISALDSHYDNGQPVFIYAAEKAGRYHIYDADGSLYFDRYFDDAKSINTERGLFALANEGSYRLFDAKLGILHKERFADIITMSDLPSLENLRFSETYRTVKAVAITDSGKVRLYVESSDQSLRLTDYPPEKQ